jgi:hypothetical protein
MNKHINRKGVACYALALTAIIMLAITFTLSCSGSDEPDNGGGDAPSGGIINGTGSFSGSGTGEKAQAYINRDKYTGNGDIKIGGNIDAGRIESGIVTLQLPSSIASTNLISMNEAFPPNCNIPSNVKILNVEAFRVESVTEQVVWIDEDGNSHIRFRYQIKGDEIQEAETVIYVYSSGAANVKCDYESKGEDSDVTTSININIAQGWNEVYVRSSGPRSGKEFSVKYSTDKSILKYINDMKWEF